MKPGNYIQQRDELINNFATKVKIKQDDALNAQFNIISAGLYNYLPSIPFKKHEEIFISILLHQQLSMLEQSSFEVLEHITYENLDSNTETILRSRPSIICTFHMGSYRAINLFLAKHNIPYSLVIASKVIEESGKLFTGLYKQLPGESRIDKFSLIDAEAPGSGLRMLKELKGGRSLLLYIDGNTGSGVNTTNNVNSCAINFLHQQIFARKGIAYLSHATGVPIVPVASYRKSFNDIRLKFFDPIYPNTITDRIEFSMKATQQLYDLVAPLIRKYPGQWESWLYLHKVACVVHQKSTHFNTHKKIPAASDQFRFNSSGFGIFREEQNYFLFQKAGYISYPIDNSLYALLSACFDNPVLKRNISDGLFNQLYEKEVFVFA